MAQVTALTAQKTLELLSQSITGAHLNGGRLILERDNYDPANPLDPETFIDVGVVQGPAGPTGGVSSSDVDARIVTAKNELLSATGTGLIAYDVYSADDPIGSTADTWYNLDGLSFNSPPLVVNNYYRLDYYAILTSVASDVSYDLEITGAGTTLQRVTTFAQDVSRGAGTAGSHIFKATAYWTTPRLIKMRCRFSKAGTAKVDNSYSPGFMSLIDLGAT